MHLFFMGFLAACGGKDSDSGHDHDHDVTEQEVAEGEPDLSNGEAVYNTSCSGCHNSNGIDIIAKSAGLSDEELAGVIANGVGSMPPQSFLSETDIRDVVAYIRTQ